MAATRPDHPAHVRYRHPLRRGRGPPCRRRRPPWAPDHDPTREGRAGEDHPHRPGPPPRRSWRTSTHASDTPSLTFPICGFGQGGKRFGREGLYRSLRRRAKRAEVHGFRPHRLRHTAAHRWLAAGGSESGLMAIAGWTRADMLARYTRARASGHAADEARRLNLGKL
ncbi:tyrosine-type recombinase/integrase [Georgenia yuyongxinii]